VAVLYCSLGRTPDQVIPPRTYTLVRFPFGSSHEFGDAHGMHDLVQPDGYEITSWDTDDRSSLVWPAARGLGLLHITTHWEAGNYDEFRDQFIRDPLNLNKGPDVTGTKHFPPSPGMQFFSSSWQLVVEPGTPIAYMVYHNDTVPRKLLYANLKMSIFTDLIE